MGKTQGNALKLYWVTTDDHAEDWFVVARSPKAAAHFHEVSEGYERGEASAKEIMPIPKDFKPKVGWPSDELIQDLGGVFVSEDHPRIVKINNKNYCEGMMEAFIREMDDVPEPDRSDEQSNLPTKDTTLH